MTDLLARLFTGYEQEIGGRPAEYFARTQTDTYNMSGFTSFEWKMLPRDRLIELQSVSVLLMQAGTSAAVRVIGLGIAVHLDDPTFPTQSRTFFAHRHVEQGPPSTGFLIPPDGSLGFNVPSGQSVMGAFTFPELRGMVVPPTLRIGTLVENVSSTSQTGWVSTSVTGWSLPRGSLA